MIQTETVVIDDRTYTKTYSDNGMMIQKSGTKELYSEAYDIQYFAYIETDIPIEKVAEEPTVEDTLKMLNELGVDTDDQ